MIETEEVFAAVRRGYTEFADASTEEICSYFSDLEQKELIGHLSNIKGILFEQEVVDALNDQGYSAAVFEATNHPATDIMLMDEEDVIAELQLKATDSASYISNTLEDHSDIPIITTHEVAQEFEGVPMVYDSGLDNSALTDSVQSALVGAGDSISDSSSDIADAVGESVGSSVGDMASDSVSDALGDVIGDSLLPIPISPVGAILSLLVW